MPHHQKIPVPVQIFSDVICPWCFIGLRHLEQAEELHGGVALEINWRSFLLNPQMPRAGMDRGRYLSQKFGTSATSFYNHIADAAAGAGLEVDFAAIKRTPDSRPAHHLVHAAKSAGGHQEATAVKRELFRAYFQAGLDIGDDSVLKTIADKHQLDFPTAPEASHQTERDISTSQKMHIQGVPYFIIAGEWALSGAQPPRAFLPLFDAAIAKSS